MRNTAGFTTMELIIIVVIVGLMVAIGLPRLRDGFESQNRRALRGAVATYAAVARAAGVSRGCRATLHFTSGTGSTLWVTACRTNPPGSAGRDTIAGPDATMERWHHQLQADRDSIDFDTRGLRVVLVTTAIKILNAEGSVRDSVVINGVGKVVYP